MDHFFRVEHNIGFGFLSGIAIVGIYVSYSFGFHVLILYPHNIANFFYSFTIILTWIIFSNILMWKITLNSIPNVFLNYLSRISYKSRNFIITRLFRRELIPRSQENINNGNYNWRILIVFLFQIIINGLISITAPFAINTIAVSMVLIASSLLSGIYFIFRRNISGLSIISIIILSYFYSTCYWFFPMVT